MRRTLHCPRCDGDELWNVRGVAEHGVGGAPVAFGVAQNADPFETFICRACGFTEWYSGAGDKLAPLAPRAVAEVDDHRHHCQKCNGRSHVLIARVEEVTDAPQPGLYYGYPIVPLAVLRTRRDVLGTFAALICTSCGFTGWYACGVDGVVAAGATRASGSCSRCQDAHLFRVDPVRESAAHDLPILLSEDGEIGHFRIHACRACGFSDWYAEEMRKLRPDGQRVLLLRGQGKRPPAVPIVRAPYR
jgi:predicted nucleic-acid-binding Zn-ribbon protein